MLIRYLDPHLDLTAPSIWIMMHLDAPGISVTGYTFAGSPGIVLGRNAHIAWGITNVGADVQDLYLLEETEGGYLVNGVREAYSFRTEIIPVRDDQNITLTVALTEYGPVISDLVGISQPVALRWVSLDFEDRTLEGFLAVNFASNWKEFRQAVSLMLAPSSNFVYADVEGNIGYQMMGVVPVRHRNHSGLFPVSSNAFMDWIGTVPFEDNPYELNPPANFIVSANNRVPPDNYPYMLTEDSEWEVPLRAERIQQLISELSSNRSLTLHDMMNIQMDQVSLLGKYFSDVLNLLVLEDSEDTEWKARLLQWSGLTQGPEAAVFELWYRRLCSLVSMETHSRWWQKNAAIYLPQTLLNDTDEACIRVGGCMNFASHALHQAIKDWKAVGSSKWEELHSVKMVHNVFGETVLRCLFQRSCGVGGDDFTINVGDYNFNNFAMEEGPSMRHIVDLSNIKRALGILPMGQSENPFSGHYDDLLSFWRDGTYLYLISEDYPISTSLVLKAKK